MFLSRRSVRAQNGVSLRNDGHDFKRTVVGENAQRVVLRAVDVAEQLHVGLPTNPPS